MNQQGYIKQGQLKQLATSCSKVLGALLVLVWMAGCAPQFVNNYDVVESSPEIMTDKVLLVGTITLVPKIADNEQYWEDLPAEERDELLKKIFWFITPEQDTPLNSNGMSLYQYAVPAVEGELITVAVPRSSEYFHRLSRILVSPYGAGGSFEEWDMLGQGKIKLRESDDIVYFGEIKIYRDDFGVVKKYVTKDSYKRRKRQIQKQFGRDLKVRKSLLKLYKN